MQSGPARNRFPPHLLLAGLLLSLACSAVQSIPSVLSATPGPSPTPLPTLDPALTGIRDGIQQALDEYARAYAENDPDLLARVVDQTNLPFRRMARTRFDGFQSSYLAGEVEWTYRVWNVTPRPYDFYTADFTDSFDWAYSWTFRQVEGRWVISEPTVEQVGEKRTLETEHFTFELYPWADDVNDELVQLMEAAYLSVTQRLERAPEVKAVVRVYPIYGLTPYMNPGAIAWYTASGPRGPDTIEIYSPRSFPFDGYDAQAGWEYTLSRTLAHEYTHLVHKVSFDDAGSLQEWMQEGLAEYVANPDGSLYAACSAARSGDLIPLVDTENPVWKQDLGHIDLLEKDIGLAYAYSESLVNYIVENRGGLEAFWELAETYDQSTNLEKALQAVFGQGVEEFERDWLEWLKGQC